MRKSRRQLREGGHLPGLEALWYITWFEAPTLGALMLLSGLRDLPWAP